MDKGLQGDTYRVFVPIEDHDLVKSLEVDENGDYIVQGLMSSDETDEEDDSISPDGMDCSYFLEKGWIKYEHGKNPNQFIGEPIEVKVGKFDHPTILNKSVNGVFVKARLFANRELTQQAVTTINDLQKSHTKRRMGWSIEGNVVKRHPKTGKVLKSIIRNCVLTMNPVNTCTWAELAKSFSKEHELVVDMDEPLDKAMDIEGAQAIAKQSLEGANPKKKKEEDPQQEWINSFRSTVKRALVEKSFRSEFITSPEGAELLAFEEALSKGLDYDEAEMVASYIAKQHTILKSLVISFGGEKMGQNAEKTLSAILDQDLEELRKSIESDEGEEDFEDGEELEKSMNEDEEGDEDGESSEGEDNNDEDDDKEGKEGEKVEKSLNTNLSKSLSAEHGQAFEVSDFLTSLTEEIGFSLEGLEKSLMNVTKNQNTLTKALAGFGDIMNKVVGKVEELANDNMELQKSLDTILKRPAGRKSVVNQREVQTLSKSLGGDAQPTILGREKISDALFKSFEAGEIEGSVVARFEGGVPLAQLNLPDHLQKSFGLK